MTAAAPTWGEIETFLRIDGWRELPSGERGGSQSDHVFYEKVLAEGRVLSTHISHSRQKRPSAGRFGAILRHQIEVSREEFWQALRTGEPVERPVTIDDDQPVEHEVWIVEVLANKLRLPLKKIEALSVEEARDRVHEFWSRPPEPPT